MNEERMEMRLRQNKHIRYHCNTDVL